MFKPQHMGALLTALAVSCVSLAAAQTKGPATSPAPADGKSALSEGDRKFVMDAAKGGALEVELGKLAEEKATNPAVKQFGQRMVQDHGKANQELAQLAQSKGLAVSPSPDAKHQRMQERLSKLSGADFDRAYVKEMIQDHEKDVKEFRRMSKQAKDPQLKAWTTQTLPTLEEHLRMVKDLQRQVSQATGKPAATTR
jgi:putative membrane protein